MRIKVNISVAEDVEHFEAMLELDTDPGEAVASIQVLYPTWTEIVIERIPE